MILASKKDEIKNRLKSFRNIDLILSANCFLAVFKPSFCFGMPCLY